MIEEDVNVTLLPLSNPNEGDEFVIAVRVRVTSMNSARRIADGIQEQLPSAGVSIWTPVVQS